MSQYGKDLIIKRKIYKLTKDYIKNLNFFFIIILKIISKNIKINQNHSKESQIYMKNIVQL
jgi:hypothetical protein